LFIGKIVTNKNISDKTVNCMQIKTDPR